MSEPTEADYVRLGKAVLDAARRNTKGEDNFCTVGIFDHKRAIVFYDSVGPFHDPEERLFPKPEAVRARVEIDGIWI